MASPARVADGFTFGASGDPKAVGDAVAMGIDRISHANNHTTDWGVEGLRATFGYLDAAGLVQSGIGRNLAVARLPASARLSRAPRLTCAPCTTTNSDTACSRACDFVIGHQLWQDPGFAWKPIGSGRVGILIRSDM
ncbi:CapA family protein [Novosphingobium sp. BW1]|uniref:CapA family protein n=1 Tax=Novosphingobium sp. BW1 TaxID=2592621 RepID=UPI0013967E1B|nr:CapA family protein [Novosphingobium sp. BW1]